MLFVQRGERKKNAAQMMLCLCAASRFVKSSKIMVAPGGFEPSSHANLALIRFIRPLLYR